MEQPTSYENAPCVARTPELLGEAATLCAFRDSFDKACGLQVSMEDGRVVRTTSDGTQYPACRLDAEVIAFFDTADPDLRRRRAEDEARSGRGPYPF